jgi:hypothetical protein
MDNSLSFFRVFDLAFFAPGTLLFGVMWYTSCLPYAFSSQGDTAHGVLTGAIAVVLIYVLGVICHGIQRGVLWIFWLPRKKQEEAPPWYINLKKDNPRNELSMYFWYMRSICWNLVVAVILGNLEPVHDLLSKSAKKAK